MTRSPLGLHGRTHDAFGQDPVNVAEVAILSGVYGTPLTVAGSGGQATVPWQEFDTTNTRVFSTSVGGGGGGGAISNTQGDRGLLLLAPGLYIGFGFADWDPGTYKTRTLIDIPVGQVLTVDSTPTELLASLQVTGATLNPQSIEATFVTSSPGDYGVMNLSVENFDTGSHNVTSAIMSVCYWYNDQPFQVIFGP